MTAGPDPIPMPSVSLEGAWVLRRKAMVDRKKTWTTGFLGGQRPRSFFCFWRGCFEMWKGEMGKGKGCRAGVLASDGSTWSLR